jgi:hypothetical protein
VETQDKVVFKSKDLQLDLRYFAEGASDSGKEGPSPRIDFGFLDLRKKVTWTSDIYYCLVSSPTFEGAPRALCIRRI